MVITLSLYSRGPGFKPRLQDSTERVFIRRILFYNTVSLYIKQKLLNLYIFHH